MDITELILHDHAEQRRLFAYLDDIDRADTRALTAVWARLRILLEVHAEAEEELFYPHLLKIGTTLRAATARSTSCWSAWCFTPYWASPPMRLSALFRKGPCRGSGPSRIERLSIRSRPEA